MNHLASLGSPVGRHGPMLAGRVLIAGLTILAGSALAQHAGGGGGGHVGGAPGGAAPAAPMPHQHFDSRFSHNQYYFDHGYRVPSPPSGGVGELRGRDGSRYWYHGGNWYRWYNGAWVIWGAPLGLFVPILPPFYTTVWWYGVPYYYANDTYYIWDPGENAYEVVTPPDGIETGGSTQPPPSDQVFIYPKAGQTPEQQAKDRYECHGWAVAQTGFDPTAPRAGLAPEQQTQLRANYFRAQAACLEGRGYTVK